MIRWVLLIVVVLVNIVGVIATLAPSAVTYADVLPAGVSCPSCSIPEVQAALIRAASFGRAQIIGLIQSTAWVAVAVALVNIAVVGALLFFLRF